MYNKKHLIFGLNTDDAEVLLDPKEYLGALNIRFVTSENGAVGRVTNIEGNALKNTTVNNSGATTTFVLPDGINTVIGSLEDSANNRVFFFVKNPNIVSGSYSHAIYCYDSKTDLIYTVIKDSQMAEGLQFDKYIHSIDILGSILSWTDNKRDPKSINADAAIKANHPTYVASYAYTFPIPYTASTVIKRPPIFRLSIEKYYDGTYNNNYLRNSSFKFMYQYTYKDGQVSALSTQSALVPFSSTAQNSNAVRITFSLNEKIPDDVQYIDIVVKFNDETGASIVKTYDKDKDAAAIAAHNAGTTALQWVFYNDEIGVNLDDVQSINSFDGVPLLSNTLTYAKNRLFLANNTTGYDTPKSNALSANVGQTQIAITGDVVGIVKSQTISTRNKYNTMLGSNIFYYVYVDGHSPCIYIFDRYKDYIAPQWPTTLNAADATAVLYSETQLIYWITSHYQPFDTNYAWEPQYYYNTNYTYITAYSNQVTIHIAADAVPDQLFLKSGSSYKLSIAFYDRYRRKCGVVDTSTNAAAKVSVPTRTSSQTSFHSSISWTLDSTNRLTEIPDWAYYYQIHVTKSLATRFFLQDYSAGFFYTKKTDTGYDHTSNTFSSSNTYATSIDLGRANAGGRGYAYQEGDLCRLTFASGEQVLTVLGVDGTKVMLSPYDFGNTNTNDLLFEIFTPYKPSTTEPMYEVGEVMNVINPGSSSRDYEIKTGTIAGDTYALGVNYGSHAYVIEAMNQNANYWKIWATGTGWSNIVTKLGRTVKKDSIQFSNVIIPGTKVNGLNTFEVLNETELPLELNGVQRLILTNKVQAEGTIMLAIGGNETASLYLGESQIFDATGESFIAKSTNVIGQVNVLRGSYGTINPESAFGWQGMVYWFDANKGSVVRYDVNGLFPISDYKMRKYFLKVGQYVVANGSSVLMGIDPFNKEILISIPRTNPVVQNEWLSDMVLSTSTAAFNITGTSQDVSVTLIPGREYVISGNNTVSVSYNGQTVLSSGVATRFIAVPNVSTITVSASSPTSGSLNVTEYLRNYYNMNDGQETLLAFSPILNKWTSKYSYSPESITYCINRLVTFKNGGFWIHNSSVYNNFYGVQFDSIIAFPHNEAGNSIKSYDTVAIEGDCPDRVHVRTETPFVQSSDLIAGDFVDHEGVKYSSIYRDRLSPNATGTPEQRLFTGDKMRGEIAKFAIYFDRPSTKKEIKFVNINFDQSKGQTV